MTAIASKLELRKLTARIGAEITGLDVSQPLEEHTVRAIRTALNEHKALVFRDIELDDEGQQRFASQFGPLTKAHPTVKSVAGSPNILPVDSEDGGRANQWHTDVTFVLNPPQASTLRSLTLPPYGGETLIANTGAAYEQLPETLRGFADNLWAVHTNDYDYAVPAHLQQRGHDDRRAEFTRLKFQTVHPVVRVHPLTGERGLFIGGFAQRLVGFSSTESRDILRLLQAYVTRAENVLRVAWHPNQLVLFDNRITQHYAIDNYDDQARRLNRVTVAGDVPRSVNGQTSYSVEGDAADYSVIAETPDRAA